ncbi:DinB family protein [Leptolyngbya sp. 7M]|uniref:DinB family protein n=1 Tax=Leptolyngbya sp. 7M TaxID=2812896 RepID=UPI001B8BDB07|nr:DinB family protein [Leptolyngbya sp. 7M]QYO66781.1 DinB family protein [Leptolyngbya sp. 7M]
MKLQTIEDAYTANTLASEKLTQAVLGLDDQAATFKASADEWSVREIVEHIAVVDAGIVKICTKLLEKSESRGATKNAGPLVSEDVEKFFDKARKMKLDAPDMVRPTGNVSITDSLDLIAENDKAFAELKDKFLQFNDSENKFPHPYFGPLSAAEWLVLRGGHQMRHLRQIRRALSTQQTT